MAFAEEGNGVSSIIETVFFAVTATHSYQPLYNRSSGKKSFIDIGKIFWRLNEILTDRIPRIVRKRFYSNVNAHPKIDEVKEWKIHTYNSDNSIPVATTSSEKIS